MENGTITRQAEGKIILTIYPLKRRFISSAGRVPIKDIDFVTQFFNGLIIMVGYLAIQ